MASAMIFTDKDRNLNGEAIRTRVMIAHALCAIAESEAHACELTMALKTVRAIRGIVQELGVTIDEPQRVSASVVRELAEFSRELEQRVINIEAAIKMVQ
jgi:hypothetical protein